MSECCGPDGKDGIDGLDGCCGGWIINLILVALTWVGIALIGIAKGDIGIIIGGIVIVVVFYFFQMVQINMSQLYKSLEEDSIDVTKSLRHYL